MIPSKLKHGDEIRVISPAVSLSVISSEQRKISIDRLNKLGLKITYSKHAEETDEFSSSSIKSRIEDLHEAFSDKNVKGILTTLGGYNSNQLLKYIDYELIQNNPKILCGFSDITALSNAIYAKTGLVGYSGPHFSTFSMVKGCEYTIDYFKKCLIEEGSFEILPPDSWSDDMWFMDQENRCFIDNQGPLIINEGFAEGLCIGGNLCTFNLLHGTEYMPSLENSILFVEDDSNSSPELFDRDLQSIIHQTGFNGVRALLIGRFCKDSDMAKEKLLKIIASKDELRNIPVIADLDFGHTTPRFTFPVGGTAKVEARNGAFKLIIESH